MNILEAFEQIDAGRKVRRPEWPDGHYWSAGSCSIEVGQWANDSWNRVLSLGFGNIRATDYYTVPDDYGKQYVS